MKNGFKNVLDIHVLWFCDYFWVLNRKKKFVTQKIDYKLKGIFQWHKLHSAKIYSLCSKALCESSREKYSSGALLGFEECGCKVQLRSLKSAYKLTCGCKYYVF